MGLMNSLVFDQTYKVFSLGASKISSVSEMIVCCRYKRCVKEKKVQLSFLNFQVKKNILYYTHDPIPC